MGNPFKVIEKQDYKYNDRDYVETGTKEDGTEKPGSKPNNLWTLIRERRVSTEAIAEVLEEAHWGAVDLNICRIQPEALQLIPEAVASSSACTSSSSGSGTSPSTSKQLASDWRDYSRGGSSGTGHFLPGC